MKGLLLGLLAFGLFNSTGHLCEGFMPENDMEVAVGDKMANDMTEKRFNQIIDKVAKVYAPIIKKRGGKLVVKRKWKDKTVNASAQRFLMWYVVNMYGGLARHSAVTDDAFALVVCHEIGHHIGGAPKIAGMGSKWASNEGQADYFGSLKCFRRAFRNDDNVRIMATVNVPDTVTEKCKQVFPEAGELALCQRASMAGKSLAKLLGGGRSGSFNTPDGRVVDRTNDRHPAAQCRLDTYFQGALCDKDIYDEVSSKDPIPGTCTRVRGHKIGLRPLCWYKPKS